MRLGDIWKKLLNNTLQRRPPYARSLANAHSIWRDDEAAKKQLELRDTKRKRLKTPLQFSDRCRGIVAALPSENMRVLMQKLEIVEESDRLLAVVEWQIEEVDEESELRVVNMPKRGGCI